MILSSDYKNYNVLNNFTFIKWKIKKLISLLGKFKLLHIIILTSDYFPKFIWRFNYFYVMTFGGSSEKTRSPAHIVVREACMSDIDLLCNIENKREEFIKRFERNDVCFIGEINGTVAGYIWINKKNYHFERKLNYMIECNDGIYYYDALTLPEFRSQGLWSALMAEVLQFRNKLKLTKIYCIVRYSNELSLKVHKLYGFKIEQKVFYLSFMGIKFHYILDSNNKPPYILEVKFWRSTVSHSTKRTCFKATP